MRQAQLAVFDRVPPGLVSGFMVLARLPPLEGFSTSCPKHLSIRSGQPDVVGGGVEGHGLWAVVATLFISTELFLHYPSMQEDS